MNNKKHHHFVPITYLDPFVADDSMLFAYRKDDPSKAIRSKPSEIGFERYYYSQPLPDERQDNNRIEDLFNLVETPWPSILSRLKVGQLDRGSLSGFFTFISALYVRVPAMREMVEMNLARMVAAKTKFLDETGQLPPKPPELAKILEDIRITVDPHMSIDAMPHLLTSFGPLLDTLGYRVVKNVTGITFITSDNPVVFFDPLTPEEKMQPYKVHMHLGQTELIFPIDPTTVVLGHTQWRHEFLNRGIQNYVLSTPRDVKRINRLISKFAYRFVFSSDSSHERLIAKYANVSPVGDPEPFLNTTGDVMSFKRVFGTRPQLPKWVRPQGQTFMTEFGG